MRKSLFLLVLLTAATLPSTVLAQPVGPEFQVNTFTLDDQKRPSVASDASGNFVVVWSGAGAGDDYGVFGQRYDNDGHPLGSEFRVGSGAFYRRDPSVASDASGNFVVVWENYNATYASYWDIYAQRYDSEGHPLGSSFQVGTYTTGYQVNTSVASEPTGNFVVVWESRTDRQGRGRTDIFGQRYDSSGNRLGGEFRVNTYTPSQQRYPSVASDADGNFIVAWDSNNDGNFHGVFGQRYDRDGNPVGNEFQVNTWTTNDQTSPSVASDTTGDFIVVWESSQQDGAFSGVFGQRYDTDGNRLGGEFQANTFTPDDQEKPSVVSDASGSFVVVWQSRHQDGGGGVFDWGIFGQRYDRNGEQLGSEFQVNTYTTENQDLASVASDSTGNFVVVWESNGQDGGGDFYPYGIFGQRFSAGVSGGCRSTARNPTSLCPANPQ